MSCSCPLRFTVSVTLSPGFFERTSSMRSLADSTGCPSNAVMMSPTWMPASAAPLPLLTDATYAPVSVGRP